MSTVYPTVYQSVIEKTKGLTFRAQVLATKVEKRQQTKALETPVDN